MCKLKAAVSAELIHKEVRVRAQLETPHSVVNIATALDTQPPPRHDMTEEWTPERIRDLRDRLGMSQAAFGQELFDDDPHPAQTRVSRIERGKVKPSSAARRTLRRLERVVEHGQLPFKGVLKSLPFQQVMGSEIEGTGDGDRKQGKDEVPPPRGRKD
jgi:DNA-binding transcriptional regulator YiaG